MPVLNIVAPGNTGKVEALEYLNSEKLCVRFPYVSKFCWKDRVPLTGIDVSAKRHGDIVYLEGIDLSHANITHSSFSGANLEGADLTSANLSGADFSNSNLRDALLLDVEASYSTVQGSPSRTSFAGADLSGAQLSGANFHGSIMLGTKHDNPDNLRHVGVNLTNADLGKAYVVGATFEDSDVSYSNFHDAVLIDVIFHQSDLSSADFSSSQLKRTGFPGTNLFATNFSDSAFLDPPEDLDTDLSEAWAWDGSAPSIELASSPCILDGLRLFDGNAYYDSFRDFGSEALNYREFVGWFNQRYWHSRTLDRRPREEAMVRRVQRCKE